MEFKFKGTKGWKLQEDGTIIDENNNIVADFIITDEKDLANAKITEQAYEMLDILHEIYIDRMFGTDEDYERIRKLIKQATEL